jgi:hypothetical protein
MLIMKCKLKLNTTSGSEAISQVGRHLAIGLASKTKDKTVPTISSIVNKSTFSKSELTKLLTDIKHFNNAYDTNSYVKFEKTSEGYVINEIKDIYASSQPGTVSILNSRNSEQDLFDLNEARSKMLTPDYNKNDELNGLNSVTVDHLSQDDGIYPMRLINEHNRRTNKPEIASLYSIEPVAFEDRALNERVKVAAKILGAKIQLTTDNVKGRVKYDEDGKPMVFINKELASTDTVFHEVIGHVFINSIGGLNDKRVAQLAKTLRENSPLYRESVGLLNVKYV